MSLVRHRVLRVEMGWDVACARAWSLGLLGPLPPSPATQFLAKSDNHVVSKNWKNSERKQCPTPCQEELKFPALFLPSCAVGARGHLDMVRKEKAVPGIGEIRGKTRLREPSFFYSGCDFLTLKQYVHVVIGTLDE